MDYRSEIKKTIQKYYPKYKVINVYAPQRRGGIYNDYITVEIEIKKDK